jgi:hypothetical protein
MDEMRQMIGTRKFALSPPRKQAVEATSTLEFALAEKEENVDELSDIEAGLRNAMDSHESLQRTLAEFTSRWRAVSILAKFVSNSS